MSLSQRVPTLVLNEHYGLLKNYLGVRAREAQADRINVLKDHYAIGVGLGVLFLEQEQEQEQEKRQRRGEPLDDETIDLAD